MLNNNFRINQSIKVGLFWLQLTEDIVKFLLGVWWGPDWHIAWVSALVQMTPPALRCSLECEEAPPLVSPPGLGCRASQTARAWPELNHRNGGISEMVMIVSLTHQTADILSVSTLNSECFEIFPLTLSRHKSVKRQFRTEPVSSQPNIAQYGGGGISSRKRSLVWFL